MKKRTELGRRDFVRAIAARAVCTAGCAHNPKGKEGKPAMAESPTNRQADSKLRHVTCCGLYCGLCANIARIPKQAKTLYETMKQEGYEFFGKEAIEGFEPFWKALAEPMGCWSKPRGLIAPSKPTPTKHVSSIFCISVITSSDGNTLVFRTPLPFYAT